MLRAINVGGRVVRMERLRGLFGGLGFEDVETYIASGNVLFTCRSRSTRTLELKIEKRLMAALGFEVATFIRTGAEVAAIARRQPFSAPRIRSAGAYCVGFLAEPLDAASRKALMALRTAIDEFDVNGREVYWLCRTRQGESTFSNAIMERALGVRSTFRAMSTVMALARIV